MKYRTLALSIIATFTGFAVLPTRAGNMVSVAIAPTTGVVTLVPRWSIGANVAGFHLKSQDTGFSVGPNNFYSIKGTSIPLGGDTSAFTYYNPASGFATNLNDVGSKLTPNSYSALTSADPDLGYGALNFYFIHHKGTTDYLSEIVPGSGTASAVTDLKPMSGPGGPATVTGLNGYFGLTFAAADLGYGANQFYYLRTDATTGFTQFGTLTPALLSGSTDLHDLGLAGHRALTFTGTDVGYGTNKMYFVRLDPVTGFSILGTLNPLTGKAADIANLGSVYSTLDFVPGDIGFSAARFYTTGVVNPTWQSVSFAAIPDRALLAGSFTVAPSASSGLPVVLTLLTGSATISAPVMGVYTVTPTAPGLITLQASQAGQLGVYETNMLRQSFTVTGGIPDFNADGKADLVLENTVTGSRGFWLMDGTAVGSWVHLSGVAPEWRIAATADFNGDGKPDLLWENTVTGARTFWLMNGTSIASTEYLANIGTDWRVAGAADFNGDGMTDIILENTVTGNRGFWLMNGTAVSSWVSLGPTATDWRIAGAADFNADGNVDIVLENTVTGSRGFWLMNRTVVRSWVFLATVSTNWRIAASSDFDGDGAPDLLWENTVTGARTFWLMNATSLRSTLFLTSLTTDWRIAN
jgi:FG-GAP-like repeat